MNAKISVFVICVETIIYLSLYNLHDCTFKANSLSLTLPCKVYFESERSKFVIFKTITIFDEFMSSHMNCMGEAVGFRSPNCENVMIEYFNVQKVRLMSLFTKSRSEYYIQWGFLPWGRFFDDEFLRWASPLCKSSISQMFLKIGVLKYFAIFTGKPSYLFLIKLQAFRQQRRCEYCKIFKNAFFIERLQRLLLSLAIFLEHCKGALDRAASIKQKHVTANIGPFMNKEIEKLLWKGRY